MSDKKSRCYNGGKQYKYSPKHSEVPEDLYHIGIVRTISLEDVQFVIKWTIKTFNEQQSIEDLEVISKRLATLCMKDYEEHKSNN